jgi:hypothetical protein
LAGTCRQHLQASGQVTERVITLEELRTLVDITLVNAVCCRYPARLVSSG